MTRPGSQGCGDRGRVAATGSSAWRSGSATASGRRAAAERQGLLDPRHYDPRQSGRNLALAHADGVQARRLVQLRRPRQRRRSECRSNRSRAPAGPRRGHLPDDASGRGWLRRPRCRAGAGARFGDPAGSATWTFILEPIDEKGTRLITRVRADYGRLGVGLDMGLGWRPIHFGMQRRQLLNLKQRAEAAAKRQA